MWLLTIQNSDNIYRNENQTVLLNTQQNLPVEEILPLSVPKMVELFR